MPLDVRLASAADAADLAAIRSACFHNAWQENEFTELFNKPEIFCLIIPGIAYALVQMIPPESELITIAVRPEYRRMGMAKNLFRQIWKLLGEHGIDTLHLEVNEELTAARALYESAGFLPVGRRPGYYQSSTGQTKDAILLTLKTPL